MLALLSDEIFILIQRLRWLRRETVVVKTEIEVWATKWEVDRFSSQLMSR